MDKVKVGIIGLGRLGRRYAENLQFKVQHAELVAACSLNSDELDYAKNVLQVPHVYASHEDMLSRTDLDAVYIISSTDKHAEHFIAALDAGVHVFCEKPLALNVEACERVEAHSMQRPDQFAVVGFVRRFDPSYAHAKKKVDEGAIGTPFFVKSQTVDMDEQAPFQLDFVRSSGGMFHDFNVHDIDLVRWFTGSNIETVYSIGGAYRHKAFAELNDADNVLTTCALENGGMASIHASRTAFHGHDTFTEVVGTEGSLRIGRPAALNRVEISDQYGVRQECVRTFYERFEEGFLLQTQDFVDCIVEGRKPELTLRDATEATRTATAMTRSFREKNTVKCR